MELNLKLLTWTSTVILLKYFYTENWWFFYTSFYTQRSNKHWMESKEKIWTDRQTLRNLLKRAGQEEILLKQFWNPKELQSINIYSKIPAGFKKDMKIRNDWRIKKNLRVLGSCEIVVPVFVGCAVCSAPAGLRCGGAGRAAGPLSSDDAPRP